MTQRSESIAAISTALAKAQGEIEGAAKGKVNPHFKNAYADLASVWDACRGALTKHGIAVLQDPAAEGATVTVTTMLLHGSGEWISGQLAMTAQQNTPQGIGSCITYARRYALASMVGVAPEDDDGNAASQPTTTARPVVAVPIAAAPAGFDKFVESLTDVIAEGTDALKKVWAAARPEYRQYMTKHHNDQWESLKARAAQNNAVPA